MFLDRDGVINQERGHHIWEVEDFEFCKYAIEFCQYVQARGWQLIVITNQSAIAQNKCTQQAVDNLHTYMLNTLIKAGVHDITLWYCPHHPTVSECFCRKPNSLWFERALALQHLNPKYCWMVGDRARDLIPANKLGLRTVFKTGTENYTLADYTISNLAELIPILNTF